MQQLQLPETKFYDAADGIIPDIKISTVIFFKLFYHMAFLLLFNLCMGP